ncbi:hypothetical protein L596_011224 [Steinernema carpocapsae]|uniref:RRM domain-containing protein n=1 Tax=Steinernema carpocapsae TaxID=34508 RepID=A0A4U5NU37_STECR|nr:hypothetical protein L596_011224 [Steinernema carpocapsae]
MSYRKLRHFSDTAYVSFESPADAQKAVDIIDGHILKQRAVTARLVEPEPLKGRDVTKRSGDEMESDDRKRAKIVMSAKEIVTPLADMPYEEQLKSKQSECNDLARNLFRQFVKASVDNSYGYSASKHLKQVNEHSWKFCMCSLQIVPSPVQRAYRNKCEFTVGKSIDPDNLENSKITVGFVGGRFAANMHYVVPVDDCDNISEHMKRIVNSFQGFVVESDLPPFNEFERVGCWKMLTVREFLGDCMVIATVFPFENQELEKQMKTRLTDFLLDQSNFSNPDRRFRVTSVYWQVQKNASDPVIYEHIGGAAYIYESLLGMRFRVSPGAFFQTNSRGAELLFSTITKACGFNEDEFLEPVSGTAAVSKTAENHVPKEELCEKIQRIRKQGM